MKSYIEYIINNSLETTTSPLKNDDPTSDETIKSNEESDSFFGLLKVLQLLS